MNFKRILLPLVISIAAHALLVIAIAVFRKHRPEPEMIFIDLFEVQSSEFRVQNSEITEVKEKGEVEENLEIGAESSEKPADDDGMASRPATDEGQGEIDGDSSPSEETVPPILDGDMESCHVTAKDQDTVDSASSPADETAPPLIDSGRASRTTIAEDQDTIDSASSPANETAPPLIDNGRTSLDEAAVRPVPTPNPISPPDTLPMPSAVIHPVYPRGARRRGEEGDVKLEFSVTFAGLVDDVSVVQSSGFKDLDTAALKAIKNAKFIPAESKGHPVTAKTAITLSFKLK